VAPQRAAPWSAAARGRVKEKNEIKTVAGKGWFPYLRFYSPTEAFFDKIRYGSRTTSLR